MEVIKVEMALDSKKISQPCFKAWYSVSCIMSYRAEIKNSMSKDFLQLNDCKSDIIMITPPAPALASLMISRLVWVSYLITVEIDSWDLGVIFDSRLSFSVQVTKVVQSSSVQLRHVTMIRLLLPTAD